MNFNAYRKTIDIVENGINYIPLNESRFHFFAENEEVGTIELDNRQLKQLFMVMGQASEFKKIQGTLKGYRTTLDVNRLAMKELDEAGLRDFLGMGTEKSKRKSKMTKAAQESAKKIWSAWEKESTTAGITPTVANVATWLKNKGVGDDILDISFDNMGVSNILSYIRDEDEEVSIDYGDDPMAVWMKNNNVERGALGGKDAMKFLKDVGVSSTNIRNISERMGLAKLGSRSISKDQYNKLNDIAKNSIEAQKEYDIDDIVSEWLDKEFISPEDFSGLHAVAFLTDHNVDYQTRNRLLKRIDVKTDENYKITREDREKLVKIVDLHGSATPEKPSDEDVIDKTENIVKQAGGSVGKAKSSAQKHINADDIERMTEMQKLAIALLASRDKVKL